MANSGKQQITHEIRQHDFYYRRCVNAQPLGLQCSPHLHNELELVYLEKGAVIAHADAISDILEEGDVFLSFPNQIHYYSSLKKSESYMLFIIKPDIFPEYIELFTKCTPLSPIIPNAGSIPRVDDLFHMLIESESEKGLPPAQKVKRRCGYLLALLSELLAHMQIQSNVGEDSNSLRAIMRYCSEHFSENISLSSLEEELHLSKYHISHLFSNKLGLKFNDYINSLRVSEACRLLLRSSESITRICEKVGFNTLRTFNRAFTKQIGLSPSEYRKADTSKLRIDRFTRMPSFLQASSSAEQTKEET